MDNLIWVFQFVLHFFCKSPAEEVSCANILLKKFSFCKSPAAEEIAGSSPSYDIPQLRGGQRVIYDQMPW